MTKKRELSRADSIKRIKKEIQNLNEQVMNEQQARVERLAQENKELREMLAKLRW